MKNTDDFVQWDKYVNGHPESSAYHFSAWGQAVVEAYGFDMMYFMALNEQSKAIGVLPVVIMRSITLKKKGCSLPYCDLGYALTDTSDIEDSLKNYAAERLKQQSITRFEYRDTVSPHNLEVSQYTPGQKIRMVLKLPENSDALMASFKSKLRSQIKKAEKNGLTYEVINAEDAGADNIDAFYHIISENMRLLGSPVHSKKWYEKILFHYHKKGFISLVMLDDTPVGAALVMYTQNTAVIPWASTRTEYNRLAPNMLLYWSVLKEACDKKIKYFDFGRSSYGEGTYKFKKQWGTEPVALKWSDAITEADENQDSSTTDKQHKYAAKLKTTVVSIWRSLPLTVTIALGSQLRKYISL